LLKDQGVDPECASLGAVQRRAPGMQDLVAAAWTSCPARSRGARDDRRRQGARARDHGRKPSALYPNVPTLQKELGTKWTMAAWRVIAAPKGIPADVQKTLGTALKKVYDSKEYKDFMASRGFGVIWADAPDAAKFMAKADATSARR
jgi:tripartite-type tricarboxylate transporter receptor subunit TctC